MENLEFNRYPSAAYERLNLSSIPNEIPSSSLGEDKGTNCGGQYRDFWGLLEIFSFSHILNSNVSIFQSSHFIIAFIHFMS